MFHVDASRVLKGAPEPSVLHLDAPQLWDMQSKSITTEAIIFKDAPAPGVAASTALPRLANWLLHVAAAAFSEIKWLFADSVTVFK